MPLEQAGRHDRALHPAGARRARPDRLRAARDRRTRSRSGSRRRTGARGCSRRRCSRTGSRVTVTFLALLLAAGAAAAERDEGTIGRLRRGLVSFGELVWAKAALAAVVGLVLGARSSSCSGSSSKSGGVTGGEPWSRLPLLLAGVRSRPASSAPPGLCSARSRARRGRRRCSPCSSCCRSSSSASSRAAPLGLAYWISLFLPLPTQSACSTRRSTTRVRGRRSASRLSTIGRGGVGQRLRSNCRETPEQGVRYNKVD